MLWILKWSRYFRGFEEFTCRAGDEIRLEYATLRKKLASNGCRDVMLASLVSRSILLINNTSEDNEM